MWRLMAATLLLGSIAACGDAEPEPEPESAGPIEISAAWLRPVAAGDATAAFYMTIAHQGQGIDRLTAADTPACASAELHESTEEDGVVRMRPIAGGIVIAPNASLVLGPGALHVMCFEPAGPLGVGDLVPLAMQFEDAGTIEVQAEVIDQ